MSLPRSGNSLERNPVKTLHSIWTKASIKERKYFRWPMYRLRILMFIEALNFNTPTCTTKQKTSGLQIMTDHGRTCRRLLLPMSYLIYIETFSMTPNGAIEIKTLEMTNDFILNNFTDLFLIHGLENTYKSTN